MKKQDIFFILLLFALMLAWPSIYRRLFDPEIPTTEAPSESVPEHPIPDPAPEPAPRRFEEPMAPVKEKISKPARLEQSLSISNDFVSVKISSHGGGITSAELTKYRAGLDPESGPVVLDFSSRPSLSYGGLPGLSGTADFDIAFLSSGQCVRLETTNAAGVRLTRLISLGEDYGLKVEDVFSNAADQPVALPEHMILVGPMSRTGTEARTMRHHNYGIDVLLSAGGEGVKHWASRLPRLFRAKRAECGLPRLPETITVATNTPVEWIAAKDKFFVQILAAGEETRGYQIQAGRRLLPGEATDEVAGPRTAEIDSVSGALIMPELVLHPRDSHTREIKFYIGPKKLSILEELGLHRDKIMEFGWWTPVCKVLLRVLNATYSVIPNYGLAIILLTILIRVVFWPLTHKSAESMRKMQALQPEMAEIRKRHKDDPKTMQAQTMALYKKHKVNPMSGCLPMIIQIPVFIALFVVLRSAIELRFASFLWIRDLSEPEGLLAGVLPVPLNILPILMAVTMIWQQKLMPTADPNQQKMMAFFMPVLMLVMFYNMPSALVLYWTASQCIMIAQQVAQKRKAAGKTPEAAARA